MKKQLYDLFTDAKNLSQSNQERKRKLQKTKLIKQLLFHGKANCAELAKSLQLSYPSTSDLTKQMLQEGIIQNDPQVKRNKKFKLNDEHSLLILTIHIYPNEAYGILYDQFQNSLDESRLKNIHYETNNLTESLKTIFQNLTENFKNDLLDILGVSFILPSNYILKDKFPTVEDLQRSEEDLESVFGKSFSISNPSYALHIGTFKLKNNKLNNSLIINIDEEIGLSIISNGEMTNSRHSPISAFGHIPFGTNGSLCSCGKRDCLETYISNEAIINKMYHKLSEGSKKPLKGEDISINSIIETAKNGNQISIDIIFELGYSLGKAISILIRLIAPKEIIIISEFSRVKEVISNGVSSGLNLYCPIFKSKIITIEFQEFKIKTMNTGAFYIAWNKIFEMKPTF